MRKGMTDPAINTSLLVVEDETDLREAMVTYLEMEGFACHGVANLKSAQRWMEQHRFDIVVLDLGLPDGDGLSWLQGRQDMADKGVIICSARGEGPQRVAGVKAGADVYLVKPVQLEELASLVHNLARRLQRQPAPNWTLNPLHWQLASPDGRVIPLTHSEQEILNLLARQPGKVVARDDIIRALGHLPEDYDPRRLEVLVRRLRTKAKSHLGYALPLNTVHGQGFAFAAAITHAGGPGVSLINPTI
jgi:two-component system OmpR family response regulator